MRSRQLVDYSNKTVAITGGTGSFGTTMLRHLLETDVEEVRVLSRDEAKQDALRNAIRDSRVRLVIGDTRDIDCVRPFLQGSSYVFHAAALKQVPTGEFFPGEMVKTNILGSQNVIEASVASEVEAVVCLSTDKAVYPINAMGMSKALMEKMAIAKARLDSDSLTRICVTRYGNVMYSRGSVLPLFVSQIKSGKKVTITNPEMTRFLMSLDESVKLVEHAFTHGKSGDLFVRKAPAATIHDVAQSIIRLLGGNQENVRTIGTRHGEKLFESLLSAEERLMAEEDGDYFRVPVDDRDLNYSAYFEEGQEVSFPEAYTSHNADRLQGDQLDTLLASIPEIRALQ